MLSALQAFTTTGQTKVEIISEQGPVAKVWANVGAGPNTSYIVNLHARTCDCGLPALTNFPCKHLAILAKAKGVKLASLVSTQDTTAYWRRQMSFDFASTLVSSANALSGPPSDLRLPVLAPRKAGRPTENRHKSWFEGGSPSVAASGSARADRQQSAGRTCARFATSPRRAIIAQARHTW